MRPAFFYLHGFASSTASAKARAFVGWGKEHGVDVRALDLRVPSLEHLRFSAIKARVRAAIDAEGPQGRAVLVGSSLGGLTACRVAEEDPRVAAVFLLAPALQLAAQWRAHLGEEAYARWRTSDSLTIVDHATGGKTTVDFGFVDELAALDQGEPDVRVPMFLVHGTKDDVVSIEHSRRWASTRPHVELLEVEDGHELAVALPRILEEATRFFRPFGVRP